MLWPEGAKKKAPNGRTFQREVSGMFRISAVNEKHAEYFSPESQRKMLLGRNMRKWKHNIKIYRRKIEVRGYEQKMIEYKILSESKL